MSLLVYSKSEGCSARCLYHLNSALYAHISTGMTGIRADLTNPRIRVYYSDIHIHLHIIFTYHIYVFTIVLRTFKEKWKQDKI